MLASVCCLKEEHDRKGCKKGEYMERVKEAVRGACCVTGERLWNDMTFDSVMNLMIDTGASTHMTNSRDTFIQDTVVACDVQVVGVGGAPIHIKEKGSVPLVVGGRQLMLHDVLLSEAAHLGAGPVHEPQVLVGVKKFARDTGLGLCFPADGMTMRVYESDVCIATAETTDEDLYVIRRQDLALARVGLETARINVALSVPSGLRGHSLKQEQNRELEAIGVKAESFSARASGPKSTDTPINTAWVYPATDQVRTRSDSQENASPLPHASTDQERTGMKGDDAVIDRVGVVSKEAHHAERQRKEKGKLIHARMHHGNSSNVVSALKKAYKGEYEHDDDPCDACMMAKARMKTRSKTHRRTAKHLGDRLHYDLFHGPSKSEEGYKYVLVVIDEFSSRSWAVGLKRKSYLFYALRGVIVSVETKMRGGRVCGLATGCPDQPHVVEVRSDNAKENLLKKMQDHCRRNGTKLETSVPYQQWQNGKAERVGGYIMKGGRALQYGGCMIERDWFKCVSAFNHVRNRTPNSNSALHDGRTPYELWHDESIPLRAQIDHLRVLGSLCYVVLPPELVPAGAKKAFKGVMLGYADESEIGQKAYIVRRLDDGKIVTATYAQTYTYENKFPYKRERDDVVEINGEERKYANDPDNGKYLDEEMSSSDSAESIDSQDELVAGLKPSAAEALDPARVEKAEDASWVSQSIDEIDVSESEHYGKGHARLVERGSLDTTSQIGEGNVMEDVDDMVRDLEINARAQPTHKYKLRQRPKGCGKHELEEKLEDRGPREPAGKYGGEASDRASHPSSRKSRTPRYVVGSVVDVARMGKKRNGDLVFRVVWENGQKTWEKKEMLLGGASRALHDFLLVLSRKQVARLRHGELEKLMKECERASEDEESSSDDDEPVYSRKAKERRQKRMQERHSVLKSMVKKKPKIALGETVPSTVKQAKAHSKWSEFAKDIKIEFDNFNKKNVWRLVPKPMNANVVSVRWVYDIKVKNGAVVRYKARLVCRGFNQKEGEDYDPAQLYAPTMKTKTLRVLVALAAKYGWDMNQYDVSCAFLHADLNEVVYVEQPLEHVIAGKENHVYVLDKAMYGLKQAPRAFATHLASCFETRGFKQSDADECSWILRKPNGVVVYALYHVDDIIMVSNDNVART